MTSEDTPQNETYEILDMSTGIIVREISWYPDTRCVEIRTIGNSDMDIAQNNLWNSDMINKGTVSTNSFWGLEGVPQESCSSRVNNDHESNCQSTQQIELPNRQMAELTLDDGLDVPSISSKGVNSPPSNPANGMHFQGDSRNNLIECAICNKSFSSPGYLKQHQNAKHSNRSQDFTCHLCSKTHENLEKLNSHMLNHSINKKHRCAMCHKSYVHKNDLKNHLITHTGKHLLNCPICSKGYTRRNLLQKHINTHRVEQHESPIYHSSQPNSFLVLTSKQLSAGAAPVSIASSPVSVASSDQTFNPYVSLERVSWLTGSSVHPISISKALVPTVSSHQRFNPYVRLQRIHHPQAALGLYGNGLSVNA